MKKLLSPEQQALCRQYSAECDRLEAIATRLYSQMAQIQSFCEENTVRREFCSQSQYMHRGFYCPSPVFDLIVGNAKRGKLLKRITSRSNPTHEYGFDSNNKLFWCKELRNHAVVRTEYLHYEGDCIYGITLDSSGSVQHISEEVFESGRLICYSHTLMVHLSDIPSCNELHQEKYEYNSDGLAQCDWIQFIRLPDGFVPAPFAGNLPKAVCNTQTYQFQRKEE